VASFKTPDCGFVIQYHTAYYSLTPFCTSFKNGQTTCVNINEFQESKIILFLLRINGPTFNDEKFAVDFSGGSG
jgi:hypothetical protein